MNANNYSYALKNSLKQNENSKEVVINFLAVLEKRGSLKLIPRILKSLEKVLEKQFKNKTKLVLAKNNQAKPNNINLAENVLTEIDNSLIGGYKIEGDGYLIDESYKTKLLKIYRNSLKK